jgi:hypothetical protein
LSNPYKLVEFTPNLLSKTTKDWNILLVKYSLFQGEYKRVLEWASQCIDYKAKPEDCAYAIIRESEKSASAIVEVVYHKKGSSRSWLKMMDVTLSPEVEVMATSDNIDGLANLMDIYTAAVLGSFKLTSERKANIVKLYGRNPALMSYLSVLGTEFNSKSHSGPLKNLKVTIEGRWLVFSI